MELPAIASDRGPKQGSLYRDHSLGDGRALHSPGQWRGRGRAGGRRRLRLNGGVNRGWRRGSGCEERLVENEKARHQDRCQDRPLFHVLDVPLRARRGRVIPSWMKWVASQNASGSQPRSAHEPVRAERLLRIFGTGGRKATRPRQNRRDEPLVSPDQLDRSAIEEGHAPAACRHPSATVANASRTSRRISLNGPPTARGRATTTSRTPSGRTCWLTR